MRAIALVLAISTAATSHAGVLVLKPETLNAWDDYRRSVDRALGQRVEGSHFLWSDEDAGRAARIRGGEAIVSPACETNPTRVPNGLIHDWIAAGFIPHAHVDDVLAVIRDYGRYKEIYKPLVLDAHLIERRDSGDRFTMTFRNSTYFNKSAIEGTFESSTHHLDGGRSYVLTDMTRIQEIEDYGSAHPHRLAGDQGNGYLWRLRKVTWLAERDGGVYVNVETIALSRDVPSAIRWIVIPIVRREARQALAGWIEKTRSVVEDRTRSLPSRP